MDLQQPRHPHWDFTQVDNENVKLRFNFHRVLPELRDCVSLIQPENENLFKMIVITEDYYFFKIKLHEYLTVDLDSLRREDSGIIIFISLSSRLDQPVASLGDIIEDKVMTMEECKGKEEFIECTILSNNILNHDCREFLIKWPQWTRIGAPLGFYVNLKPKIDGSVIQKSYTPFYDILSDSDSDQHKPNFKLMIKEQGQFSSYMHSLETNSTIMANVVFQQNIKSFWKDLSPTVRSIVLVASSRGIAQMIRLIKHFLFADDRRCDLIFFNETEKDLIYKKEFEDVEELYKERFKVSNVLSQPGPSWNGLIGDINDFDMSSLLDNDVSNRFFVICGIGGFNEKAVEILRALNVAEDKILPVLG